MKNIPETITKRSMSVAGTPYEEYCCRINSAVKKYALKYGAESGEKYVYEDGKVRFTYIDSPYGNDKYRVDIARSVWDDLPDDIDPFMVNEGGRWNTVYQFQSGRDVLTFHLPGSWTDTVELY